MTVYYLPARVVDTTKKSKGIVRSQGLNMGVDGATHAQNVTVPWTLRTLKQRRSWNNQHRTFCPITCPYAGDRALNAENEWYHCDLKGRNTSWDSCLRCDCFSCDDEEILT